MGDYVLSRSKFKMSVGFSKILRPASQLLHRGVLRSQQQVRHGGGAPKMNIVPTRWSDLQFRELLGFYFTIVGVPFIAISTYCNIFIGSAKLKPIPDGYEPREEEYERHPLSRWLMKNYFLNGQMVYETKLHAIWEQWNYSHRAMLIDEIKIRAHSRKIYHGLWLIKHLCPYYKQLFSVPS